MPKAMIVPIINANAEKIDLILFKMLLGLVSLREIRQTLFDVFEIYETVSRKLEEGCC
jgi:hypothetical protein